MDIKEECRQNYLSIFKKIKDEFILEVGVGYGYYKDAYFNDNKVTGYDVNAFLGKNLGIEIIEGKASDIRKVERKFDRVLSFFMTEYLDYDELTAFIKDSYFFLLTDEGGCYCNNCNFRFGTWKDIYNSG